MKSPVTFRIDHDLLERARRSAKAENRTLTNFVETVLKAAVERQAEKAITSTGQIEPPRPVDFGGIVE